MLAVRPRCTESVRDSLMGVRPSIAFVNSPLSTARAPIRNATGRPMPISASLGHASVAVGKLNQDFVGMATPVAGDLATKGIVAAVADGVRAPVGRAKRLNTRCGIARGLLRDSRHLGYRVCARGRAPGDQPVVARAEHEPARTRWHGDDSDRARPARTALPRRACWRLARLSLSQRSLTPPYRGPCLGPTPYAACAATGDGA